MSTKKLGRPTDQRLAMVANLATDLLWYGRIETTLALLPQRLLVRPSYRYDGNRVRLFPRQVIFPSQKGRSRPFEASFLFPISILHILFNVNIIRKTKENVKRRPNNLKILSSLYQQHAILPDAIAHNSSFGQPKRRS